MIRALVEDDCELEIWVKGAIVFVTENHELQILHNSVGVQSVQTGPLYQQVITLQSCWYLLYDKTHSLWIFSHSPFIN